MSEEPRAVSDYDLMALFYRLDGHTPVPEPDVLTWGAWYEAADRHVADDTLPNGVRVSTVFLGLDHGFTPGGLPVLFETMIFGGPHDQDQWRYSTWDEAVSGHAQAVAYARLNEIARGD